VSLTFLGGRGDEGCRVGWEEKEKVSRWEFGNARRTEEGKSFYGKEE